MNNRRIWFRLGGVLAAAAVCTGGAAVVSDRAQEAKNVQRAFLGAMETQMQIGCYPSETGSPADLTEPGTHGTADGIHFTGGAVLHRGKSLQKTIHCTERGFSDGLRF